MDDRVRLQVKQRFQAPPERVFDAWIDPQIAAKWLFATPHSRVVRASIDARVGGGFVFVIQRDGHDIEHVGEYLAIDRPRHLAFTFAVPALSPEHDHVSVEIAPTPDGCELTLTTWLTPAAHAEWGQATQQGWRTMLAGAAGLLQAGTDHRPGHPGEETPP